jgi:hypothetical protein
MTAMTAGDLAKGYDEDQAKQKRLCLPANRGEVHLAWYDDRAQVHIDLPLLSRFREKEFAPELRMALVLGNCGSPVQAQVQAGHPPNVIETDAYAIHLTFTNRQAFLEIAKAVQALSNLLDQAARALPAYDDRIKEYYRD